MSDEWDVDLGRLVYPECASSYVDSWWGQMMVRADLFPYDVTWAVFGFSLARAEFITFYAGLTFTANLLINRALRTLFDQPPPLAPCGGTKQMPALATQHSTCIALFALLVVGVWSLRLTLRNIGVLFTFVAVVTYARIYIGSSSVVQLLAGSAVGVVVAMTSFAFYWFVVHPNIARIIRWPPVRLLGLTNTLDDVAE